MTHFSRAAAVALLVPLTLGGLAACTNAGSAAGSSAGGHAAAASSAGGGGRVTADTAGKPVDRSVTTTGELTLTAKDPVHAATAITGIVTGAGGRVQRMNEEPSRHPSADLTVRIPAAGFEAALAAIERQGTVTNVSITATDVTARVTDYAVRIAGLRASITRLQALLGKASTTTDLVDIESTLTTRETDLEQLLAQQKGLADAVAYATLDVAVVPPALVHRAAPADFLTGLAAGWAALAATGSALIVVLGVLLPWLAAAGILAVAVVALVRLVRSRRRGPAASA